MATRGEFQKSVRTLLREQLLDAARDLLIARGWANVRMSDVADGVGVSRQTVYNEFGNKHNLAEALVMRETNEFLTGIQATLERHHDDLELAIAAAVEFTLSEAADNPLLKAVLTATRGGAEDLLPYLTTRSQPILEAATALLLDYFDRHWAEIPLDIAERRILIESVVRLVISHLVMPLAPAQEIARQIAWIASQVIDLPGR